MPSPDPLVGRVVGGCRLDLRLAQGGMGAVYRATQLGLDRAVAVKVMLSNPLTRDRSPIDRFFREARVAQKIRHPHVVRVYEVGIEAELVFMVMELVEGPNLKEVVRRAGPLRLPKALTWVAQAARGLEASHALGVVHRDIKPANLLIAEDVGVKVTDFGLVKGATDPGLTRSGLIVGTPEYMSPEACRGEAVDRRADLYALGGTLFFALTAQPPFHSDNDDVPSLLLKHAYHPAPDPRAVRSDIPPGLARLVQELLAKEPERRPQSAGDLARRLEQLAQGVEDAPVPPAPRGRRRAPKRSDEGLGVTEDEIVRPGGRRLGAAALELTWGEGPPVAPVRKTSPLSARDRMLRAKMHLRAARWEEAAQDLAAAAKLQPSAAAYLGLARALSRLRGRENEAVQALRKAISKGCRDRDVLEKVVAGSRLASHPTVLRLLAAVDRG